MTNTQEVEQKEVPVLFLDIDGTVRQSKDDALGRFVNGPEDVVVFPEAVTRMYAWKEAGGRIIGVSNQGGIALGHLTDTDVRLVMNETYRQCDNLFDDIVWCPHYPPPEQGSRGGPLRRHCWCRKPFPGMPIQATTVLGLEHPDETYHTDAMLFVGDRPEDEACAKNMNVKFQSAQSWRSGH